ncbi:MAG: head-tail connector protein [Janthinobacterium lividum]
MKVILHTVVEPVRQPVTLEQLRGHVRVDATTDNAMLLGYLIAARSHVEHVMGRPIIPRTVRATFDCWPGTWPNSRYGMVIPAIELMLPVTSVDAVNYADAATAVQPWTGWLARTSQGGATRVRPATGQTWPVLGADPIITLDATAGFPGVIPEPIVTAILMTAAHFYANRESVIVSDGRAIVAEVPQTTTALVLPYRSRWIG